MTREEFIKVLDEKGYKWREEGEWIIIEEPGYAGLSYLETIPDNVKFNNGGNVDLESLRSMGDNVQFNNGNYVVLRNLESIPDNVRFNNRGNVYLDSLKSIPINVDHYEMFPECKDIRIKFKWLDIKNRIFSDSRWKSVDTGKVQMYESWLKNNY